MDTTNSSPSLTSSPQPTPNRPDATIIEKCKKQLIMSRNTYGNWAKDYLGFKPQLLAEMCSKLDEGIDYVEGLAGSSLQDAHDISLKPCAAAKKAPMVLIIDTATGVAMMVEHIVQSHVRDPSRVDLFVDTEDDRVTGGPSLIQIFVESIDTVYLIDMIALGAVAFTTPALSSATTLQDLFESTRVKKAIYGVIGDSHELWKSYGIDVAGVEDMHLLAIAAYGFKRKAGGKKLLDCVRELTKGDLSDAERTEWLTRKEWGTVMFNEAKVKQEKMMEGEEIATGWVPEFSIRPITTEVKKYAVADVTVLPNLYRRFAAKLPTLANGQQWVARVAAKMDEHIKISQSLDFDPDAKRPWGVPEWEGMVY